MCENQNMEKKTEEVKVMHSQHARILKEDDEIWISSEDLNTENSSDEDKTKTKHAIKRKLKLKNRKRSSPNIRLQRPSIPSVASTSKDLDDRLLMPATEDIHSRSTDESRTSDEEYQIPPIPSECLSECLSKRLSLEDWRPMRGALNVSSLEETASAAGETRKIVKETGNFYNAMLYKLKSLKSCSVAKTAPKEKLPVVEKTFKYLKNTPEVRQKLNFINKLDEEINETISRYKAEREERLSTEFEMCKNINDRKLGEERDVEVFLEMCNFEARLQKYREQAQNSKIDCVEPIEHEEPTEEAQSEINAANGEEENDNTAQSHAEEKQNNYANYANFVRKNICAAKEGVMAGFSLTDEEKVKIADILKDIDDFQLDDAELALSTSTCIESNERSVEEHMEDNLENELSNGSNAFSITERHKTRIEEIDNELQKYNEEKEARASDKPVPVVKDEEFWKKYVLGQKLKEIDAKLENLYKSYLEDEEKLQRNINSEEEDEEKLENVLAEEIEVCS